MLPFHCIATEMKSLVKIRDFLIRSFRVIVSENELNVLIIPCFFNMPILTKVILLLLSLISSLVILSKCSFFIITFCYTCNLIWTFNLAIVLVVLVISSSFSFSAILCNLEYYQLNSMVLPIHSGFAIHHHYSTDAHLAHWLVSILKTKLIHNVQH